MELMFVEPRLGDATFHFEFSCQRSHVFVDHLLGWSVQHAVFCTTTEHLKVADVRRNIKRDQVDELLYVHRADLDPGVRSLVRQHGSMATVCKALAKLQVRKFDERRLTELSWTFPEARDVGAIKVMERS